MDYKAKYRENAYAELWRFIPSHTIRLLHIKSPDFFPRGFRNFTNIQMVVIRSWSTYLFLIALNTRSPYQRKCYQLSKHAVRLWAIRQIIVPVKLFSTPMPERKKVKYSEPVGQSSPVFVESWGASGRT